MNLKFDNNIICYNYEIKRIENFINICCDELIQEIFSQLNLASLNISCCVSKKWRQLASEPLLWKKAIHRELAFGILQWAQCCSEEAIKDESREEEFSSLPLNIVEYYKKYQRAFPDRKAKEDLMLIWLPKTWHGQLTLDNLAKLGERYFCVEAAPTGCSDIQPAVKGQLVQQSIPKSYWALATKEMIPGSGNLNDTQQQCIFDVLSQGLAFRCNLPNALEAGVCFFAKCLSLKDCECSCDQENGCSGHFDYIVCQERIQDQQVIVACCIPLGSDSVIV